jgi:uncharacterized protein (UPF0147 family)
VRRKMVNVDEVVELIDEIQEESSLPKNVRNKLDEIIACLKDSQGDEIKLTVDKCVNDLEEVSGDVNIPSYVRTQLWSVVSMLESLE